MSKPSTTAQGFANVRMQQRIKVQEEATCKACICPIRADHRNVYLIMNNIAIQKRLKDEIVRKLKLAVRAEQKEDRDIVCSEVFADITGELNEGAKESTGYIYSRWYEVLAAFFCRDTQAGEEVLSICKRLWGQPFTAPIFALLLHQWLLVHPEAGGVDERLKHINILVSGSRQLFQGDLGTHSYAFKPLYSFIAEQVVFLQTKRLEFESAPARESLIALMATFLPYYAGGRGANILLKELDGEQFDFVIARIVDFLSRNNAYTGDRVVIDYLNVLLELKDMIESKVLATSTRIRLQGTIYSLTRPGGPRYASKQVNAVALRVLDTLFPHGKRTRRFVFWLFNIWFFYFAALLYISKFWWRIFGRRGRTRRDESQYL